MFNLIPTEPDEYKIYADWLEDQGVVLTTAVRKGILPLCKNFDGRPLDCAEVGFNGLGDGGGCFYFEFVHAPGYGALNWDYSGFPYDDEYSIQVGCYGTANLDIFYGSRFVDNETHESTRFILEKVPVVAATLMGRIYVTGTYIQSFAVNSSRRFTFTGVSESEIMATDGSLNLVTGELDLIFNLFPSQISVIVSYEYSLEPNPYRDFGVQSLR